MGNARLAIVENESILSNNNSKLGQQESCSPKVVPQKGLGNMVESYIHNYFLAHEGLTPSSGLYECIIKEVEKPLLRETLKFVQGNQTKAAEILGINRNTLRRKLMDLDLLPPMSETGLGSV